MDVTQIKTAGERDTSGLTHAIGGRMSTTNDTTEQDKQYPRVSFDHHGGNDRFVDMINGTNKTVAVAVEEFETERGRKLTLAERREYFRGWRAGKAFYALNDIRRLVRYLNADELDTIGEELYQLGRKWGVCRTDAEMRARLAEGDSDAHS